MAMDDSMKPERWFQTPGEVAQALSPFFRKAGEAVRVSQPEVSRAAKAETRQDRSAFSSTPGYRTKNSEPMTEIAQIFSRSLLPNASVVWKSLVETGESGMESEDGGRRVISPAARRLAMNVGKYRRAGARLRNGGRRTSGVGVFRIKTKNGVIVWKGAI